MRNESLLQESFRYMGVHSSTCDEQLHSLVLEAIDRVTKHSAFRFVCEKFEIQIQNNVVALCEHTIVSHDLAKHLRTCEEVFLFAATLGSDVDRLLARDAVIHPALAIAEQAVATALIEQFCDDVCLDLQNSQECEGYFLPRFSPGYGDCSLKEQPFCIRLLQATQRIGLTCTDAYMLSPMKSITAFIGVSKVQTCSSKGCSMCSKTDCQFRKV